MALEEVALFRQCIRDCLLQDHLVNGPLFTWSNKQEGENRVFSKIDKVLANSLWFSSFTNANAMIIPEDILVHCACIVNLDTSVVLKVKIIQIL